MDTRIEKIFRDQMEGDKSFQDNSPSSLKEIFFGVKYTNYDMKETWDRGIKHGIEIGLNVASLEGQIIELNNNTTEEKDKKFLEEFYKLAEEYGCAIQYHPRNGMVVLNSKKI